MTPKDHLEMEKGADSDQIVSNRRVESEPHADVTYHWVGWCQLCRQVSDDEREERTLVVLCRH